jgi:hypothetical protein
LPKIGGQGGIGRDQRLPRQDLLENLGTSESRDLSDHRDQDDKRRAPDDPKERMISAATANVGLLTALRIALS